jgi:hypothetical protein
MTTYCRLLHFVFYSPDIFSYFTCVIFYHHYLPWIMWSDLFRHRCVAIVSWGVHGLFFLCYFTLRNCAVFFSSIALTSCILEFVFPPWQIAPFYSFTALAHFASLYFLKGESNGKLPLRICLDYSVPEPYRLPGWALVPAKNRPKGWIIIN